MPKAHLVRKRTRENTIGEESSRKNGEGSKWEHRKWCEPWTFPGMKMIWYVKVFGLMSGRLRAAANPVPYSGYSWR